MASSPTAPRPTRTLSARSVGATIQGARRHASKATTSRRRRPILTICSRFRSALAPGTTRRTEDQTLLSGAKPTQRQQQL
eukprot:1962673-Rhodomonas_salina.1